MNCDMSLMNNKNNKANLRGLIAATGPVIPNEIQMDFSYRVTLNFERLPQETTGNFFRAPKSYIYNIIS